MAENVHPSQVAPRRRQLPRVSEAEQNQPRTGGPSLLAQRRPRPCSPLLLSRLPTPHSGPPSPSPGAVEWSVRLRPSVSGMSFDRNCFPRSRKLLILQRDGGVVSLNFVGSVLILRSNGKGDCSLPSFRLSACAGDPPPPLRGNEKHSDGRNPSVGRRSVTRRSRELGSLPLGHCPLVLPALEQTPPAPGAAAQLRHRAELLRELEDHSLLLTCLPLVQRGRGLRWGRAFRSLES